MLDSLSTAVNAASPPEEADDNFVLHVGTSPMEGTWFTMTRVPYREDVFSQGGVYRRIPELGGSVQGCSSEGVWTPA